MTQRLTILILAAGTIVPMPCDAQNPQKWEDCWPIPTLAQEIAQMQQEQRIKNPSQQIRIERLVFEGQTGITSAGLTEISEALKKTMRGDTDHDWLDELGERVRDAWQEHGHFLVKVADPKALVIRETALEKHFAVTVQVEAGQVYHLDRLEFSNGKQLSSSEMRPLFPIRDGDVFNTHRIQKGLENLRKAYGTRGFANFGAIPSMAVDEKRGLIQLVIDLDEGKQFRIGQIRVFGRDTAPLEGLLHDSGIVTGNIFDASRFEGFFERNRSFLPPGSNPKENLEWKINESDATVDLTFDFRECPEVGDAP